MEYQIVWILGLANRLRRPLEEDDRVIAGQNEGSPIHNTKISQNATYSRFLSIGCIANKCDKINQEDPLNLQSEICLETETFANIQFVCVFARSQN